MADNERVITTVFRADISNFSKSTQDLNRYVSQVNSEFKLATSHLGKWSDSTEGLQAKLTQLNGVLTAEQKKLANMEQAYADLVAQGKENTKEAQNLATAINNQRATVNSTIKNIDHYSESLKGLEDAGVETREELDKLNKENEELKENAKAFGGNLLKGFAIGLAGIATACVGVVKGLASIVEETKELRTQMGMMETAFSEAGLSADSAEKTFDDLFGVLGDSGKATEASLQLGQLAKNEEELLDYTNILTGVYATFGDSLPVEGLAEAMNHTANLGSVQGVLADALEWSGVNVDTFNEQLAGLNTEEERAKLINDTLNGIYGETATKYKEVNKEVIEANKAQNAYNQAMADIGEKAQPIITTFKTAMVGVLQAVLEKFNEVDIEGIVSGISTVITESVTWILDNGDTVKALIIGIGTAFLTWKVATMIQGVVGAIKALTIATEGQTIAQRILNGVMKANPIGLVVTAVGLLVTAFALLWNKCEGFRNFFIGMWEKIKTIASGVAGFIGDTFKSVMNTVKGVVNGIISLINGAIGAVNKIKVNIPKWIPEYGGETIGFNIPKIPKLAKGAIVDQPTLAMVGEAGREAVMPLEHNTEWIDKLAEKLNASGGGGNTTNNFNYTFEKMESSRLALHKAKIETMRIVGGRV